FVAQIDTESLGLAIIALGGGRKMMGDVIDHSVGLEMLVRVGDQVDRGQPLVRVFSKTPETVRDQILNAIQIAGHSTPLPLIVDRIAS
ncbi:MAG: hypothetical protein ACK58L_13970, partial [Planctomycetota bacterium]